MNTIGYVDKVDEAKLVRAKLYAKAVEAETAKAKKEVDVPDPTKEEGEETIKKHLRVKASAEVIKGKASDNTEKGEAP